MGHDATIAIKDSFLTSSTFDGDHKDTDKIERWLEYFENYTPFRNINNAAKLQMFKLLLTEQAAEWLRSLLNDIKNNWTTLLIAFCTRFATTDNDRQCEASSMWTGVQGIKESVDTHIMDIINMAKVVPITDQKLVHFAIIKGHIKLHVLQTEGTAIEEIIQAARLVKAARTATKTAVHRYFSIIQPESWNNDNVEIEHCRQHTHSVNSDTNTPWIAITCTTLKPIRRQISW